MKLVKASEVLAGVLGVASAAAFGLNHLLAATGLFIGAVLCALLGFIFYCWPAEKSTIPVEIDVDSRSSSVPTLAPLVEVAAPTHGDETKMISLPAEMPLSKMSPSQIIQEVRNARPFQKEHVAKSFVGSLVCWRLALHSVTPRKKYVSVDQPERDVFGINLFDAHQAMVNIEIESNAADQLRLLDQDELVTVRGVIEKVDPLYVRLGHGTIEP